MTTTCGYRSSAFQRDRRLLQQRNRRRPGRRDVRGSVAPASFNARPATDSFETPRCRRGPADVPEAHRRRRGRRAITGRRIFRRWPALLSAARQVSNMSIFALGRQPQVYRHQALPSRGALQVIRSTASASARSKRRRPTKDGSLLALQPHLGVDIHEPSSSPPSPAIQFTLLYHASAAGVA